MRVLTHRVLPQEKKQSQADTKAIAARIKAGDALNLGDTGKAVAALQRRLKQAGVLEGAIDGTFDQRTADAVAAFQKAKKLESSGIVGGKTAKALRETQLFVKDGFAQSARLGHAGSDVLKVERQLEKLGFRPGKVDGVLDEATQAAIARYRKADHQVADTPKGIGADFAKELTKASRNFEHDPFSKRQIGGLKQHARLDALTAKSAKAENLKLGAKGRAALNVQKHLEAAGFEIGTPNGQFNSRTEAATKAFQRHSGLPQTGEVDARTWSKLKDALFAAKNGTSPSQKLGERSAAVLRTEKQLKKLGYKVGSVDGRFTAQTRKAVKAFQKRHKLEVSGNVGGGTSAKLAKVIKQRSGGAAVQTILETARKHLGFHERGANGNPFSSAFGRPAEAWCADFVSYCARKAGLKLNTASAQGVADFLKSRGTWKGKSNPKPGDALTFRWDGSGGWADHVGIVEKVFMRNGRKYVQTIEGNSGDAVRRKVYPANSSVINGYGTIR